MPDPDDPRPSYRVLPRAGELGTKFIDVVRRGKTDALRALLDSDTELATTRFDDGKLVWSTLHLATEWPGMWPNAGETVRILLQRGADIEATLNGAMTETALHWAASSDNLDALNALLEGGADVNVPGAVIGLGTPLADAVAFGKWAAAERLVECGATIEFWQAAGLGRVDLMQPVLANMSAEEITNALWTSCHAGQRETTSLLLDHGADASWIGHNEMTPRSVAIRDADEAFVAWFDEELKSRGLA